METRQSKRKSTAEWEVEDRSVFESGIFFSARQAIRRHATGGNVLIAATVLALVIANIPSLNHTYFSFWEQEVRLQLGDFNRRCCPSSAQSEAWRYPCSYSI